MNPFLTVFQLGTGSASTIGNLGAKQFDQAFHDIRTFSSQVTLFTGIGFQIVELNERRLQQFLVIARFLAIGGKGFPPSRLRLGFMGKRTVGPTARKKTLKRTRSFMAKKNYGFCRYRKGNA